ncbi:methyltransferase regulatory domain-containing protein [Paludisphaera borealis]|uniref:tRNA (Guanine-N(7)-)-methyltransferase n=1 Tax=Paludisphaera borealis TaxID=1387353 RepID=A0A1U7CTK2_9BACT|nr:class I SAM-dependent methyltransferase [Paludisphaera borealis]APW62203.1 tRNA (guanine-N(7)-)-methyltransferase [Paludisphaera borealis]
MLNDGSSSYDELPYSDNCFYYTHPDHMATVAALHGLSPSAVERCRVLELGCAMGGNLIPMAIKFPDAQFVGIDLSARQIGVGRSVVEKLGLRNVDLRTMSIADVDDRLGRFDYIVCHGVFSWVPAPVRDKILAIFSANLAPEGIAYVSYNTYPGWHARGLARDLMAFHVRNATELRDSVQEARAFLTDLVEVIPDQSTAYSAILRAEGEFLSGVDDTYLYHEHLEETNNPLYFHQFMSAARAKGLDFLAEAKTPGLISHLPQEARERIEQWGKDEVAREQYVDFVTNRTFRRTYLCHEGAKREGAPASSAVASLCVGTLIMPESTDPDVLSDSPETFRVSDQGATMTSNHPLLKTALVELSRARPRLLPFDVLFDRVWARLKPRHGDLPEPEQARRFLCDALIRGFAVDLISLNVHPPSFTVEPGDLPVVSPLARLQAERGERFTNLQGRTVEPEPFDRIVLRLLDGTRTRSQVVETIKARVASGELSISDGDEQPVGDDATIDRAIQSEFEVSLRRLTAMALLIA